MTTPAASNPPATPTKPVKPIDTTPVAAASVVLLRDGPQGLEVLLLRRHDASAVMGGAYVFPGGKVDAADAMLAAEHLDQPLAALHDALGEQELPAGKATGLYVAAAREAFEECGVLLAHGANAQGQADRAVAADTAHAARLLSSGQPFGTMLAQLSLQLNTQDLVPWSRWITPVVPNVVRRRFDTRFFVAALPSGQSAMHDNVETTESVWLAPRAALESYWAKNITLAAPQIMGIAQLVPHANTASVMAEARARKPPLIEPMHLAMEGGRMVCYPGDPNHPVQERRLLGPTRLSVRGDRFEPFGGIEELLGR